MRRGLRRIRAMEARIGREDGALQHFLGTPVEELVLGSHGDVCPDFVMDQLLKTASDAGKSVPAYRQLLEEKGLDPGNLQLSEVSAAIGEAAMLNVFIACLPCEAGDIENA